MIAANTTRKLASMTAAINGSGPGVATTSRPASHKTHNDTNGRPLNGVWPVQFGIAVRRKPVITAGKNPNSISWMCHSRGA